MGGRLEFPNGGHHGHRLQAGPIMIVLYPFDLVTNSNGASFNPAMTCIHGAMHDAARHCSVFAPIGFQVFMQGSLVSLDG